jgi:hypothetical protein
MDFDSLFRTFLQRPGLQRLFMAFTVGLFLSCAARVSEAQPTTPDAPHAGAPAAAPTGAVVAPAQ